jgi:hypothetical protein
MRVTFTCVRRTAAVFGMLVLAGLAGVPLEARADASGIAPDTPPPAWWLQLRSTAYILETRDLGGGAEGEVRSFQHFGGAASGLAGGRIALRAAGRLADDVRETRAGFARSRLDLAHLEARLSSRLTARLGRQFVQGGATSLTLDGLYAGWRPAARWDLALWGGARAPLAHDFEAGRLDDDQAYGARLAVQAGRRIRLAFSAARRERDGAVAARPLGWELAAALRRDLHVAGRAIYDLEGEAWGRAEGRVRWRPGPGRPGVTLQVVDRRPSVDAASWFARFADLARVRVVRAVVDWEHRSRFGGEVEVFDSRVDGRTARRMGAALLAPFGRLGYSVRFGDVGEESSLYGDFGWDALSWLRVEGEASLVTYALLEDAPESEERELTTLAARLLARLRPGVGLSVEVQSLDNPYYDEDVRLLVGLDLTMGRGASRFGLDRGRWLR